VSVKNAVLIRCFVGH